jgi:hypothetical protein
MMRFSLWRTTGRVTLCLMLLLTFFSRATASTWLNTAADDDWNNTANWGGGDFTGGAGVVPTQAGNVGVAVRTAPLTLNQSGLTSLYMIVNGPVNVLGGDLVYTGDGLWGSAIGGAAGGSGAVINQSGGTITQTGGGAGFLIGHNVGATYTMTGGSLIVQAGAPSLTIDWVHDGTVSAPSTLNIGGNAVVDVASEFLMGPQGTLNVTDDGLLIWRNRTLADLAGNSVIGNGPRLNPSANFNARAIQVGQDVHFVRVPEPAGILLMAMALFGVVVARQRV